MFISFIIQPWSFDSINSQCRSPQSHRGPSHKSSFFWFTLLVWLVTWLLSPLEVEPVFTLGCNTKLPLLIVWSCIMGIFAPFMAALFPTIVGNTEGICIPNIWPIFIFPAARQMWKSRCWRTPQRLLLSRWSVFPLKMSSVMGWIFHWILIRIILFV